MAGDKNVLSVEEVAEELNVHYMTAYARIRNGEIPAFKVGRVWRVRRSDLDKYMEEQLKKARNK